MNAADPMLPGVRRIVRRTEEMEGVVTLELASPEAGFRFQPGQFNMLYAFGVGEVPISISGDPGRPESLCHTIRAVGQVSHALTALQPGMELGVRGPLGQGWPLEEARGKDLVLAAGGLGLAPLRPVLLRVMTEREHFRQVVLYYGSRSPETLLWREELATWRAAGIRVEVTVDRATPGWQGEVGVVTRLMQRGHFDPEQAVALLCGPEVMMRFSAQTLRSLGIPERHIHLSMERNMNCGVGLCGHCQFGPKLVCRDGPVFALPEVERLMQVRGL
jgi:NAD(P)H-flavin reductase